MSGTSFNCTSRVARIRTTELTTRITVMLILTLSSCLFRETSSLIAGRANTAARNGAIRRNQLSRLLPAGANAKTFQNKNNGSSSRLFFQLHDLTNQAELSAFSNQRGHTSEFQNKNRYRTNDSIRHRCDTTNNCFTSRIFARDFSTNAKADDTQEVENSMEHNESGVGAENRTESSESQSTPSDIVVKREPLLNVLSIDPNDVDIYEREEDPASAAVNNEGNKGLMDANPFGNRNFIEMFRGSANYIASHRNSIAVFHIPGDLMEENPAGFRDLMNDISLSWLLGMKIVIVAGCGFQVNKRHKENNNKGRNKHMGMVMTDPETLRLVKEEAGYVRFEVERQLARALKSGSSGNKFNGSEGSDSVGGNVVSGNFYSAQPFGVINGVDYEYSGFVRRMEVNKINQVLQNRDIVLLTSLGFSPTGEVFNVNSEYLAAHAAGELGASKMVYFLQKNAALRHKIHGSNIPHLRVNDGQNLLDLNGVRIEKKGFVYLDNCPYDYGAEQSFLVKMGWGMTALRAGVKRVHLISPYDGGLLQELYTRDGSGTMISGDLYDGIHNATVDDATAIYEVITPLVEKGILVERTKAELERDIDQYHVYTRDGLLIACGQLKMFENGYAEFGCLVVNPLYRAKGRGDAMLGYLERLCVQNGATSMFVLSTQTMEWFVERGFDEVGVDSLPPSRQATYNHERASKIYLKKVHSERDLDANELFWDR